MKYTIKGVQLKAISSFRYFKFLSWGLFKLSLGNKPLFSYWWHNKPNFGDAYNFFLLSHYGYAPILCGPNKAKVACTGSIIEHLPNSFSGAIIGAGFISENTINVPKYSKVLAVRGEYSKNKFQGAKNVILGDPGLLAYKLLKNKKIEKKKKLGIILHYAHLPLLKSRYSHFINNEVLIIDPRNSPKKIIKQIACCENIISSSLHGLIFADSLFIPNKWLQVEELIGGHFKFKDYYSAMRIEEGPLLLDPSQDIDFLVSQTWVKPIPQIKKIQKNLDDLFKNLN